MGCNLATRLFHAEAVMQYCTRLPSGRTPTVSFAVPFPSMRRSSITIWLKPPPDLLCGSDTSFFTA